MQDKNVFEFDDFRKFLAHWISRQPSHGHGQAKKIAEHLKLHSTMISHILKGKQKLSDDQACSLAEYMGLGKLETRYFMELARLDRAGTPRLRNHVLRELEELRRKSRKIRNRLQSHSVIPNEQIARFYSSWHYSAIRLASAIPRCSTTEQISETLSLPEKKVRSALEFLIEIGLCNEKDGKISMGPAKTHLPDWSEHVWTLHRNWRIKAMERHGKAVDSELFFTAPMVISAKEADWIRERLLGLIQEVSKVTERSKPEQLMGLNIDWYRPA